jgi:hypothetical protein
MKDNGNGRCRRRNQSEEESWAEHSYWRAMALGAGWAAATVYFSRIVPLMCELRQASRRAGLRCDTWITLRYRDGSEPPSDPLLLPEREGQG